MSTKPGKSSITTKDGSYLMQSMISILESSVESENRSLRVLDFVSSAKSMTIRESERRQVPHSQDTVIPSDLELSFIERLKPLYTNSLGMQFVYLEEIDAHVSKYETTRGEFARVLESSDAVKGSDQAPNWGKHPQNQFSWVDAVRFCVELTEREHSAGTLPTQYYYRLPFDVEWSAAAGMSKEEGRTPNERERSGKPIYAWGSRFPPSAETPAGNYADEVGRKGSVYEPVIGYDDGWQTTAPVGSYDPNSLGLYDLSGNVWEWCYDFSDPFRTVDLRVARGGSWFVGRSDALDLRCRYETSPYKRTSDIGFRCVVARRGTN